MNNAIKNGSILGVALIIGSLILSLIDTSIFLTFRSYILLIVFIAALVYFGNSYKKQNGGFLSFGSAFKYLFVVSAIGVVLCTIFEYVLFNFISPDLIELQRELAMEAMDKLSAFIGEDAMEIATTELENKEFNSIGMTIQSFLIRLLFPAAGLSLIIGAIIKKKDPSLSA